MNWFQNSLNRFRSRITPDRPMKDLEGGTNVSEQFAHYITQSIRIFYRHRIISPVIYLGILLFLFLVYPLKSLMFPTAIEPGADLEQLYHSHDRYISVQLQDLHYTGYTRRWLSGVSGYYYYTVIGDKSIIVLLAPDSCDSGRKSIDSVHINGRIMSSSKAQELLLVRLSDSMKWADSSLDQAVSSYMISEPDGSGILTILIRIVIWVTGIFSIASIIGYLMILRWPKLSLPVLRLAAFGNSGELLEQAEQELATVPQLATEDMFITEHFFIETSAYGVAIVPIQEILWVYKYSTMHRLLWQNLNITYTLHITATHHQTIHCPRNTKSNIDGIMDYLAEANHNILVGFTENNRRKVAQEQGENPAAALFRVWFKRGKSSSSEDH